MKRTLLVVWMVVSLVVGILFVLGGISGLLTSLTHGVLSRSGGIFYMLGQAIALAIGVLLVGEFNRTRKRLHRQPLG